MAVYPVLDVYLLCGNPLVGGCLGDLHAVSELEDLLGCSAGLRGDREHRGSFDGEYCGLDVSISACYVALSGWVI